MIRDRLFRLSMLLYRRLRMPLVILGSVVIGAVAAVATNAMLREATWPYEVVERRIVSSQVERGGSLALQVLIDYRDEDCWRQYDRRVVSRIQRGPQAGEVFRPPAVVEQRLPIDQSGQWQTWTVGLPATFPCGPAYLVESVVAACTWWQRNVRLLRKPDVKTPLEVVGCESPAN